MTQHFLLSRPAKTLSLAQVFRMSDTEAEAMFRKGRWPETDGAPVCPHCGGLNAYECRRPNGLLRFRCRACREDFTITSGTLFAFHKVPLRGYLAAIAIFAMSSRARAPWQSHAISACPTRPHSCCFISSAKRWPKK